MMLHQCLTIVGLSLDIVGVCLLFCFALPSRVPPDTGSTWTYGNRSPADERKAKGIEAVAYSALVALVVGFGLQIAGSLYAP